MAVTKRPVLKKEVQARAEQWIEGAAKPQSAPEEMVLISLRIRKEMVSRVDAAAHKLHLTRSAWMLQLFARELNDE